MSKSSGWRAGGVAGVSPAEGVAEVLSPGKHSLPNRSIDEANRQSRRTVGFNASSIFGRGRRPPLVFPKNKYSLAGFPIWRISFITRSGFSWESSRIDERVFWAALSVRFRIWPRFSPTTPVWGFSTKERRSADDQ